VLGQRRVYILPTGAGLMFAVTIMLMLIGSINYNLSLGYVLVFLLAGNGMVAMLHTWRNLARTALRPGKADPVFAGESATFRIYIENNSSLPRTSLAVQLTGTEIEFHDVPRGSSKLIELKVPALNRGIFYPGRLRIFTTYPIGLFYAWALVDLDMHCLVYPKPEMGHCSLPLERTSAGERPALHAGEEDFAGLRTFRLGDSPRRIAWKAFARNELLLSKQFSGGAAREIWLDFHDLPIMDVEAKLSRLARWVIESEVIAIRYGLRLPGTVFSPDSGVPHRERCLQALALFRS
jgi:uncharacterized protein (DUF58 family)